MSRPLIARLNLAALAGNFAEVRRHAPHAKALAVIKANGYGHGMLRVARVLAQAGTDGFAVLSLHEAEALRDAGFQQRILMLEGFFSQEEIATQARRSIATVVHSPWQLEMLERTPLEHPLTVYLKINTGMNRLGFRPEDAPAALQRLRQCAAVEEVTLMTHFATADEQAGIAWQLPALRQATAGHDLPGCFANSAAILRHPESHADWVRPGILLYGSSPFAGQTAASLGLQPVMTLQSRLIAVQDLQPGETLGYGATFRADQPTRIGVVACGYADGYPRHAPTGTPILVNGQRTRTLGRVSMDMLFADLTAIPNADVGTPVTLWGEGMPVDEVASAAGTISYELLSALAQRVPVVEE